MAPLPFELLAYSQSLQHRAPEFRSKAKVKMESFSGLWQSRQQAGELGQITQLTKLNSENNCPSMDKKIRSLQLQLWGPNNNLSPFLISSPDEGAASKKIEFGSDIVCCML